MVVEWLPERPSVHEEYYSWLDCAPSVPQAAKFRYSSCARERNSILFARTALKMRSARCSAHHKIPVRSPNETAEAYADREINPQLSQALVQLCKERPKNPIEWLARRLLANKLARSLALCTKVACKLRTFHINDVYNFDNLPTLATCISLMSSDKITLKVLAGDFLAPSTLSTLDHGKGMVKLLDKLAFDVVCFGNNECDVNNTELYNRIVELEAVWLNSNMRSFNEELEGTAFAAGKCPDHHCVQLAGGRSVALIGLNSGGPSYRKSSTETLRLAATPIGSQRPMTRQKPPSCGHETPFRWRTAW